MSDLIAPLVAGSCSIAGTLIASPVWAPRFWLKRTIVETSSALSSAPADSTAHRALLATLNICSAKLAATFLVPLRLGWPLLAWLGTVVGWAFGTVSKNDTLASLSLIVFFAVYVVGLSHVFYVNRLRGRQAAAMLANRASGFIPLRVGEITGKGVVSQRLVDRELSLGANVRIGLQRRGLRRASPALALTSASQ